MVLKLPDELWDKIGHILQELEDIGIQAGMSSRLTSREATSMGSHGVEYTPLYIPTFVVNIEFQAPAVEVKG